MGYNFQSIINTNIAIASTKTLLHFLSSYRTTSYDSQLQHATTTERRATIVGGSGAELPRRVCLHVG